VRVVWRRALFTQATRETVRKVSNLPDGRLLLPCVTLVRMGYFRELRALVGPKPLIAVGADVVVLRGEEQVLLQLRRDGHYWSLPGGALEPGESLEDAARRELLEETGLAARNLRLLTVCSGSQYDHTYPNGDRIHNVVAIYLALGVEGELRPDSDEGLELRYFSTRALPEMPSSSRRMSRSV
jgi:ADP-ribose pyrophosphatase YjhB (NUDIX family)